METLVFEASASVVDDLDGIAGEILSLAPEARIFALHGEMGVGKTTLVKHFCRKLGVTDLVNSPTFSIVNEYAGRHGIRIFHFDFYRINKQEEIYDMGYEEYFFSGEYCFIEWPEKLQFLLPVDSVRIFMEDRNGERNIRI